MKLLKAPLLAAAALGVTAMGFTATSAGAQPDQTVPVDVWSLRTVVNAVQVSPDGKHVLVHVNPSERENIFFKSIRLRTSLNLSGRSMLIRWKFRMRNG